MFVTPIMVNGVNFIYYRVGGGGGVYIKCGLHRGAVCCHVEGVVYLISSCGFAMKVGIPTTTFQLL